MLRSNIDELTSRWRLIIGYAKDSTTQQSLGLEHCNLKPAFVDPTETRSVPGFGREDCVGDRAALIGSYPE
jgi:hypothetical protein